MRTNQNRSAKRLHLLRLSSLFPANQQSYPLVSEQTRLVGAWSRPDFHGFFMGHSLTHPGLSVGWPGINPSIDQPSGIDVFCFSFLQFVVARSGTQSDIMTAHLPVSDGKQESSQMPCREREKSSGSLVHDLTNIVYRQEHTLTHIIDQEGSFSYFVWPSS